MSEARYAGRSESDGRYRRLNWISLEVIQAGQTLRAFSALILRGCESFNLGDLARVQHARPHDEEARHSRRSLRTLGCDARRLEPWRQIRTRGHPSRRPRHSASKTRVDALRAQAPQLRSEW